MQRSSDNQIPPFIAVTMTSVTTSAVWYYFVRMKNENGKLSEVYRYCNRSLALSGGSTGNLRLHRSSMHPTISVDRTQQQPASSGRSSEQPVAPTGSSPEHPAASSGNSSTTGISTVAAVSLLSTLVSPQSGSQPLRSRNPCQFIRVDSAMFIY